ncbi:MAG: glycoside hydrolase family 13 protein, partial [Oscillospiraceae bacterium]|nr:glycoside hydrolase family 13 protein [Oscillospiraceae bacterium]
MSQIFSSRNPTHKTPFGAVPAGTALRFSPALPDGATLVFQPDGGEAERTPLINGTATVIPEKPGLYFYWFEENFGFLMDSGGKGVWLNAYDQDKRFVQLVYEPDFRTPEWFWGGVMYQIFPDRFCASGTPKGDVPADRYLRRDWGGQPLWELDRGILSQNNDYFGGDFRGIESKLDYLAGLGVSVIYLNPIFEAHSNHRYNTADYLKSDPLLGTEEDFTRLCRHAKFYGIRVILDGVFSHVGDDSRYFNKSGRYGDCGAYQKPGSPFASWFFFGGEYPCGYRAWWNVPSLPETNEDNPEFRAFVGRVLEKWLSLGASGFRLDVADELPDGFLVYLRETVKIVNPEAIVIGEVWEDASVKISQDGRRAFLWGKELDSVMNYPFYSAVLAFLRGGRARDLMETVLTIYERYPRYAVNSLMNHMGTHDTERLITALAGAPVDGADKEEQAKMRLTPEERRHGEKFVRLAAVLQFTLPGVPSVYYGDEKGMEGGRDPFNRGCFAWENGFPEEERGLTDFYRSLGGIRRENPAFAGGDFIPVFAEAGHIAYIRERGNHAVFVAVNRWIDPERVTLPEEFEFLESLIGRKPEARTVWVEGESAVV